MLLQLDFESEEPIYLQIRNQIVQGIAAGALRDGERLPTIRAFADESGVNMMTVSKAYQQLRREGYLTADRRGGTVVSAQPRGAGVPDKTLRALRLCLSELRVAGLDEAAAVALCRETYREATDQGALCGAAPGAGRMDAVKDSREEGDNAR